MIEQAWDLLPVSREEFDRRLEDIENGYYATMDTDTDDEATFTHYTEKTTDAYLGSIKISEDGVEYLVPELVDEECLDV